MRTHWVLVVMDQFTRRVLGFGVHCGTVDGMALCRMFQRAIHGHGLPKYVSSDHDPLYRFHQWQASLRVLEMNEIKTVPHVPLSHPFVQRLMVRFGASTSMGSYSGPLLTSRRRYSIFKITSKATGPTRRSKGRAEPTDDGSGLPVGLDSYRWQGNWEDHTPIAAVILNSPCTGERGR